MTAPLIWLVAVSGFIGRSWAIAFSRAGYEIGLHDPTPGAVDAALAFIDEMLEDLAKNDLLNGHSPAAVRGRIRPAKDVKSALDGAIHVQENAPENLATKLAVFKEIDALAPPGTVLASSASALLPSLFTEALPETYYALILMDGDRMGAWLAGNEAEYKLAYRDTWHSRVRNEVSS